jgi:hypothetical protein
MQPKSIVVGLVAGILLAGGFAWLLSLSHYPDLGLKAGPDRYAIATASGPVFFGKVVRVTRDAVVLTDVYYLQSVTDPKTNERVSRLLQRATTDIHGPTTTTIPADKIVLVETVGPDSQVAKSIASATPAPETAPPAAK